MTRRPRVLVTRAPEQARALRVLLEARGLDVVEVPLIRFEPCWDRAEVEEALARAPDWDLAIFTSANAVQSLESAAAAVGVGLRQLLPRARVVAVGPTTARALIERGLELALQPRFASSLGMASAIDASGWRVKGKRVLYPRAENALDTAARWLRSQGALVTMLTVYRTRGNSETRDQLQQAVKEGVDVVCLASPSAANGFRLAYGHSSPPSGTAFACIGPTTAQAAARSFLSPRFVAQEHTAAGLADAVSRHLARRRKR